MKIILTVRVDSFEKSKLSPLLLLNEGKLCAVRCQVNHYGHRPCDNKKPGALKTPGQTAISTVIYECSAPSVWLAVIFTLYS